MATIEEAHQFDTGTKFVFTVKDGTTLLPILDFTQAKIIFGFHDETVLIKDLVFDTDGSDSKMKYITERSDLSVVGPCKVQAFVQLPEGEWYSKLRSFNIATNIATIEEGDSI